MRHLWLSKQTMGKVGGYCCFILNNATCKPKLGDAKFLDVNYIFNLKTKTKQTNKKQKTKQNYVRRSEGAIFQEHKTCLCL